MVISSHKKLIMFGCFVLLFGLMFVFADAVMTVPSPSPANNTNQSSTYIYVNISGQNNAGGNISTWFDFWNTTAWDLVAYWNFDNNLYKDNSTYGNNLTKLNPAGGSGTCTVSNVRSIFNNGIRNKEDQPTYSPCQFYSNGSSLNITGNFTIAVWINITTLDNDDDFLFGKRTNGETITVGSDNKLSYGFSVNINGSLIFYITNNSVATSTTKLTSTKAVSIGTPNTWTHIAGVYNGTTGMIYINGTLDSSINHTGGTNTSKYPFFISNPQLNSGGSIHACDDCSFDEMFVFSRALSEQEIQALASLTNPQNAEHNFTNLADGTYQFRGYMTNSTGFQNDTGIYYVTIDASLPTITIQHPANQTYIGANITFNFTIGDSASVSQCKVEIRNTNTSNPSCRNFTLTEANLSDGSYIAVIRVNDSSNNVASASVGFTFTHNMNLSLAVNDTTANQGANINISTGNATWENGTTIIRNVQVNWTRPDGILERAINFSTTNTNGQYWDNFTTNSTSQNGTWTIFIAQWVDQNSTTRMQTNRTTFTLSDITVPTITIQSPINSTNSSDTITVNYTVGDNMGISQCLREWTNQTGVVYNKTLENCANETILIGKTGSHIVRIWVNDTVNNVAVSTIGFSINTSSNLSIINLGDATVSSNVTLWADYQTVIDGLDIQDATCTSTIPSSTLTYNSTSSRYESTAIVQSTSETGLVLNITCFKTNYDNISVTDTYNTVAGGGGGNGGTSGGGGGGGDRGDSEMCSAIDIYLPQGFRPINTTLPISVKQSIKIGTTKHFEFNIQNLGSGTIKITDSYIETSVINALALPKEWVNVERNWTDLPANRTLKFNISVSVPEDAEIGKIYTGKQVMGCGSFSDSVEFSVTPKVSDDLLVFDKFFENLVAPNPLNKDQLFIPRWIFLPLAFFIVVGATAWRKNDVRYDYGFLAVALTGFLIYVT